YSRCGRSESSAVIFNAFGISVVIPSPFACTCTNNVYQLAGTLASDSSSAFHGSFGGNEIEFGELRDFERTCKVSIRFSQSITIVGTIRPDFPKARINTTTNTSWSNYEICPSRKNTNTDTRNVFVREIRARWIYDIGSLCLVIKESEYWITRSHLHTIRVIEYIIRNSTFVPISSVYGYKSSIVTGIKCFIREGVFYCPNRRCHARPGTTECLRCLTLY